MCHPRSVALGLAVMRESRQCHARSHTETPGADKMFCAVDELNISTPITIGPQPSPIPGYVHIKGTCLRNVNVYIDYILYIRFSIRQFNIHGLIVFIIIIFISLNQIIQIFNIL